MNVGLQDGIIDPKHEKQMGASIWLYLWCVKSQTRRKGGVFVLGGMPLSYAEIAERSKFEERRVRRWLDRLRKFGYVRVTYTNYMKLRIEILKAKKWGTKQSEISFPTESTGFPPVDHKRSRASSDPLTENGQSGCPKVVNGVSKNGQPNKKCSLRSIESNEQVPSVRLEIDPSAVAVTESDTAAAFSVLDFDKPIGNPKFRNVWTRHFIAKKHGEYLTDSMEDAIQECQRDGIGVPAWFFDSKRNVEKIETSYARARIKGTPYDS